MTGNKISLVMATYGRSGEVFSFLRSVATQQVPLSCIEVIVVDQNDRIDLGPILDGFRDRLSIVHIKSDKRGLSRNRNIGLQVASGDIVAFPDDDCQYYPDTLASILKYIQDDPDMDIFLGRIFDRELNRNVMRPWPDEKKSIDINNVYLFASSIVMFVKKVDGMHFDAQLGVGARFGGYEDVEFVLRSIKAGRTVAYRPAVQVMHPELNRHVMSRSKVFSYGLGFGAMCRKHASIPVAYLFFKSIGFHLYQTAKAMALLDGEELAKGLGAIASRIWGFLTYSRSDAAI